MITIPNQLKTCKFILINHNVENKDKNYQKRPLEKDWPYTNNYDLTSKKFQNYIRRTDIKRYGVLCGSQNLIVIDFDNAEVQKEILDKKELPETFTVKTAGKGLYHLYYYTDLPESWKCFNEKGDTLFDVQGFSKFVVGPNSELDDGKKYIVEKDISISYIGHDKLIDIFKDYVRISASKTSLSKNNMLKNETDVFIDDVCVEVKKKWSITQALQEFGVDTSRNPTECPLGHGSIHKASFSYEFDEDKSLFHCFHCEKSGDVFTLYQEKFGWDFNRAKRELVKKAGVTEYNVGMENVDLTNNDRISDKDYKLNMKMLHEKALGKNQMTPLFQTQASLLLHKRFIFVTKAETDEILFYDEKNGIYVNGGDILIKTELEKYFSHLISKHINSEITAHIQRMTLKNSKEFNTAKNMICLNNGVYDLETGELRDHDPSYFFLNKIHVNYDKSADCPLIDKFFDEVVEPKYKELMYEVIAFTIFQEYIIQKAVILYGIGANGKSVYLDIIRKFLGQENVSAETLQNLATRHFSVFNLYNKLANICGDLDSRELGDTGKFKVLTSGNEPLQAEQKFKNSFTFVNKAKLIFSCNCIPPTKDTSDAFFRRWVIVIFPHQFNGLKADKDLHKKLTVEKEMSGLFNRIIGKYNTLNELKDFAYNASTDEIRELYIKLSNPVATYLDDAIAIDPMGFIPKQLLYDTYKEYCFNAKIPHVGQREFNDGVKLRFKTSDYYATLDDGNRVKSFRGIAWSTGEPTTIKENKEMSLGDFE